MSSVIQSRKQLEPLDVALLRSALRKKVRQSRESRFLHRLHCVLLLAEGQSTQDVATWFGEHPRTLDRWRDRFLERGIEGLTEDRGTGRPPKIPKEQLRAVAEDIRRPPQVFGHTAGRWQGKLLQQHLEDSYDVSLSLRHCQRLLKDLRQGTLDFEASESRQVELEEESLA